MEKKLTIENTRGLVDPCIYMLTSPNGKIYVGSSINGFHRRSNAYRNENAHCLIGRALKKYAAKNFTFSIPESSKAWGKDKLQKREQHYLDTLHPFGKRGYNIERVAGVVSTPTRCVSQFTRAGEPLASFESAKWASVVTGVNRPDITTCCKGKLNSAGGSLWLYSEKITPKEMALRVERAASIVNSSDQRSVSQYTRVGEFIESYVSIKTAARATGVHDSSITRCCKSKARHACGYLWLYPEDVTPQEIELRVERAADEKRTKPVSQFTRAGIFINGFESGSQAARETGVGVSCITQCCKGKQKTARGYLWLYSEEITPQEIARRVEQAESVVRSNKRGVSQFTRAGVLVKEYEYGSQAARETGVNGGNITMCCKGKMPSAGGFIWKYT